MFWMSLHISLAFSLQISVAQIAHYHEPPDPVTVPPVAVRNFTPPMPPSSFIIPSRLSPPHRPEPIQPKRRHDAQPNRQRLPRPHRPRHATPGQHQTRQQRHLHAIGLPVAHAQAPNAVLKTHQIFRHRKLCFEKEKKKEKRKKKNNPIHVLPPSLPPPIANWAKFAKPSAPAKVGREKGGKERKKEKEKKEKATKRTRAPTVTPAVTEGTEPVRI